MSNDNGSVKTFGTQRIGGVKLFDQFPITPPTAPAKDYQAANKKYVDDNAGVGTLFTLLEVAPGLTDIDGNWRFVISGTDFLVQYNNGGGAGNWVTKGKWSNT